MKFDIVMSHFSIDLPYEIYIPVSGSVDKTMDFQRAVPGSNLLAAVVVPLGKALYPHCLVARKGLKAIGSLVACL